MRESEGRPQRWRPYLTGSELHELLRANVRARFQQLVGEVGYVDADAGHLRRRRLGRLLPEVPLGVCLSRPGRHIRAEVSRRPQRHRLYLGVVVHQIGQSVAVAAKEALPL